jgi:hypothetical protein
MSRVSCRRSSQSRSPIGSNEVLGRALFNVGSRNGAGCYTIRVRADADPRFDFSSIRTYAWLPDPPGMDGDPELHNELIDRRVRRVVNRELDALGYELVPVAEADIHVTYYLALETHVQWRVVATRYQYSRAGWVERHRTESARREYDRGSLLLDLLNPEARRLVWRGSARARVRSDTNVSRRRMQINEAVAKLVARMPNGPAQQQD